MNRSCPAKPVKCVQEEEEEGGEEETEEGEEGEEREEEGRGGELCEGGNTILLHISPSLGAPSQKPHDSASSSRHLRILKSPWALFLGPFHLCPCSFIPVIIIIISSRLVVVNAIYLP